MTASLRNVLRHIHRAARPAAGQTDDELLSRFAAARDEGAFAALLGRYGPLVLSVCRRLLAHDQDAEDAFQATFLVLVTKAGSVAKRESVGSWLYGVAYRTALRAREAAARRRREAQAVDLPDPAAPPAEPEDWEALYAELERLPEKYRAALVLCDLQGSPRREAAAALGLPEGTLSSRLASGRRMLGDRLARRGFAPAAGALAATAAVPDALAASTSSMAALVAAGQLAAVEASVATIAEGVLRAMVMTKVKFALAAALAVGLVTGGAAISWGPPAAEAQSPSPPATASAKPASELEALRQENELLRVNLRVLLEKVKRQEAELDALKGAKPAPGARHNHPRKPDGLLPGMEERPTPSPGTGHGPAPGGDGPAATADPDHGARGRWEGHAPGSAESRPREGLGRPAPASRDPVLLPDELPRTPGSRASGALLPPEAAPRVPPGRAKDKRKAKDELEKTIETLRRQLRDLEGY
jgi:RNA polymerase sigma factor (sigma-70 family)